MVADWLPLLFRCRGCCSCSPVVGGRLCGSCRGGCQLVGIGCASCRGVAAHVGRLVAFLVALRCVGWLSVGRGAAVLMSGGSRLSCGILSGCRLLLMVSPRCREGVAVILSGSVAVALRCQSVGVSVALRLVAVALRCAFM